MEPKINLNRNILQVIKEEHRFLLNNLNSPCNLNNLSSLKENHKIINLRAQIEVTNLHTEVIQKIILKILKVVEVSLEIDKVQMIKIKKVQVMVP